MLVVDVLTWLLIGVTAGWVAHQMVKGPGLLGDLLIGIVGALNGGVSLLILMSGPSRPSGYTAIDLWSAFFALIVATILLFAVKRLILLTGARATS
ncbi:MAG TPA: hypothetical protein VHR15_21170 [Ktedonobacterales bacterium]|jgi:uncharacterized membrane protein YeaQ/YmgE (transglycosylase-associated protein family)|nr:hypothetical protein [Ktedonobacterales bacterium]